MRIHASTLRKAFFRLYSELATVEGVFVDLDELTDAWPSTGLRHSDLPRVVQDLKRCRMLLLLERGGATAVRLEIAGIQEFHRSSGYSIRDAKDWLLLARAALRRIYGQRSGRRLRARRADDRRMSRGSP